MKSIPITSLLFFLGSIFYKSGAQIPTPPVPLPPAEEEIFKVVEEMPRFPGCENSNKSNKTKENCAKGAMLAYIYETLEYPKEAKEKMVEGMAVVQFTIWKDSTIRNIKVVRDPGEGTGNAAARVVESMKNMPQKWRPGHQRGRPVCVQYTLPVKFKLDDMDNPRLRSGYKYNDIIPFRKLHENPRFPDCENIKSYDCTSESLIEFIQENQIYPKQALANGTEGIVKITFVIERNGKLSSIKARNQIPDGISEDAVGIFEWMNTEKMRWTPGKMDFKPVRSYYTVNVSYNLNDWNSKN